MRGEFMEFGMFHEFPSLPGRSESAAFDEAMEQVDAAERLGLDVMWLAELHFEPRRSVLSAPLSIASAIAARTRRIKIGIAVQVLPLCHPLRLAEEAATVDQLSHGRLIFGVGRSGVAQTYEAYGVSYAESRERFREILDIVERAWTEPSFSYDGAYHRFKNVAVVPKPYQRPMPPIRIAASTRSCGINPPQLSSARIPLNPISACKDRSFSRIVSGLPTRVLARTAPS